ncbi:MAG: N-acetyltransferase [Alphaproteobacteria bacterium]|nr:N-acetyltransferase [Alphaproteobacteria bacterium]
MKKTLLKGDLVTLRAPEPADIEILYTWENDPSVWDYSNTLIPFSRFQIEEYILASGQDIFSTRQLRLMIDFPNEVGMPAPIGTLDIFEFDPVNQRAGVGILICEPHRKQGCAFDALSVLIRYAFTKLPLHQLFCNIAEDNEASIRLFEKAGFKKCGMRKDWIRREQGWAIEIQFQLIREEHAYDDH